MESLLVFVLVHRFQFQFDQKRAPRCANIVLACEDVTPIDVILIEIQNGSLRGPEERK